MIVGQFGGGGGLDAAVAGEKYEPVVHTVIRTCFSIGAQEGVARNLNKPDYLALCREAEP